MARETVCLIGALALFTAFATRGPGQDLASGQGQYTIADYSRSIAENPLEAGNYIERGRLRCRAKDRARGIEDFNVAIRLDPKSCQAFWLRGLARSADNEFYKAIADLNEAVRLDPTSAPAHFARAYALKKDMQYASALADANEAVRLEPQTARGHDLRAEVLAACPEEAYRDGRNALEAATRACALSLWENPWFVDTLAAAYAEMGDFERAVQWQEKANKMHGEDGKSQGLDRLQLYKTKQPFRLTGPTNRRPLFR